MIVAEETGDLNFFYVKPYEKRNMRYKCLAKVHLHSELSQPISVTSFSFDLIVNSYFPPNNPLNNYNANHHLIGCLGTQDGKIYLVNLNPILKMFNIEENHQMFATKSCVRC